MTLLTIKSKETLLTIKNVYRIIYTQKMHISYI